MGCPLNRLLDTLSSTELSLYTAYFALEGIPEDKRDWRAAMIASVMANCLGGAKANISDFMPKREQPPQDWRETKAIFKELANRGK